MRRFLFLSPTFCICIFFFTESRIPAEGLQARNSFVKNNLFHTISRIDTLPENPDQLNSRPDREAQFHGGNKAWTKFVSQILTKHVNEFNESDYGTCIIKFAVDIKGTVCQAEATTMKGSRLARVIIEAVKRSPKWIPAEVDGQPVNSYRILPVTLTNPRYQ